MKKKLVVILLLCSLAALSANAQEYVDLRVMSYNILYGAYPRPAYTWGNGCTTYTTDRADAIIAVINSVSPDILLLQECNQWADIGNTRLAYFSEHLNMPYYAIAPNHRSFKLALLSKYPIENYEYLGDDVYYYWNILTAQIRLNNNFSVKAASNHFGWWGAPDWSYENDEEVQAASYAAQKAVLMDVLAGRVNDNFIIGGDWNHSATQSPFGLGVLHDEIAALGYGLSALQRFQPGYNPIDNIYVSPSPFFQILNCERVEGDAYYVSDHLPVYADIRVITTPVEELVARWRLDNSLSEYNSLYYASAEGTPVYAEGIIGTKAVQFSGNVNEHLTVSHKQDLNLKKFTVTAWAKMASGGEGTSRVLLSNRNDPPDAGYAIYVRGYNNWAFLFGASDSWHVIDGPDAVADQWTLLAASFLQTGASGDDLLGTAQFYVNGVLAGTLENVTYAVDTNFSPFTMGCDWTSTSGYFNPFAGLLDDVRYYSYALSDSEITQLYANGTGQIICIEENRFDYNGDCVVDVLDFVFFCEDWLDNGNIYPTFAQ